MNFIRVFLLTATGLILIVSMVTALNNNYFLNNTLTIKKLETGYENQPWLGGNDAVCPGGIDSTSYTIINGPSGLTDRYVYNGGNSYTIILEWTPTFCQAGTYDFSIEFNSPNCEEFTSYFHLVVNNVNRSPTISVLPLYQKVLRGSTATVDITAQDLDYSECHDDSIALSVADARGGTLTDNGNGTGTFSWTPGLEVSAQLYNFVFRATDNYSAYAEDTAQIQVRTLCGDASNDGKVNVTDVITLINYLFKGGTAPADMDAADVNNDGKVNVTDVIYLINYLFKGGSTPNCGY